jgi:hypothetical protein
MRARVLGKPTRTGGFAGGRGADSGAEVGPTAPGRQPNSNGGLTFRTPNPCPSATLACQGK